MKIVNKQPNVTSDISAGRGSVFKEFWKLTLSALVLLIALYFLTSMAVDVAVSKISFETEAKIFNAFQLPDIETNTPEAQEELKKITAILNRLNTHSTIPPLPYQMKLMEMEQPNAFAFPGGTIGVTTGLLNDLNDEIEIAFVIGHELGHFYHRDHLRGLGRSIGFGIVMSAGLQNGWGANSFTSLVNGVLERKYSQEREQMADRFGIELIYNVYGEVQGTDRLFQILQEQSDRPKWAYMFSTHPSPQQRIDDLEAWVKTNVSGTAK